jgi:tetratricopeptide (TPR) repeat protein
MKVIESISFIPIVILFSLTCCSDSKSPDDTYELTMKARHSFDTAQERLGVVQSFLAEFPESRHSPHALFLAFTYMHEMGNTREGIDYVEGIRALIKDPEIGYRVDKRLLQQYGQAEMLAKMLEVAQLIDQKEGLSFPEYDAIIRAAIKKQNWAVAEKYTCQAKSLVSPEAYRMEQSGQELSEVEVESVVRNREGILANYEGWIKANLGRFDEALTDFANAEERVRHFYIEIPFYGLNLNWAKTLMMVGDYESALERLAPDALIMGDKSALLELKDVYEKAFGTEEGFDNWTRQKHLEIAKTIDNFSLPDYEGKMHDFESLSGKVTCIAFWFPT